MALGVLGVLAAVSCGRSPASLSAAPSGSPGPPLTVTGWITEIEYGKLSLRTTDGRSLIFTLEHPPKPLAELRRDMAERSPIRITYRAESGQLVPRQMDDPCPGPDCPPPYVQPTPFSTPSLVTPGT
jgi:hypothetical protein